MTSSVYGQTPAGASLAAAKVAAPKSTHHHVSAAQNLYTAAPTAGPASTPRHAHHAAATPKYAHAHAASPASTSATHRYAPHAAATPKYAHAPKVSVKGEKKVHLPGTKTYKLQMAHRAKLKARREWRQKHGIKHTARYGQP
jgi:hypothetical protein